MYQDGMDVQQTGNYATFSSFGALQTSNRGYLSQPVGASGHSHHTDLALQV